MSATLDQELAAKKSKFLSDLKKGKSIEWIIVMGNEAGDLDSLSSSIAYSYFASSLSSSSSSSYIPLQLTPHSDLYLRPENLESLSLSNISPTSLLTLSDLPPISTSLSSSALESNYVLVDHNSLLPMFRSHEDEGQGDKRVVGIIDHHVDESQHLDANPRILQLVGSCSSLVTNQFLPSTTSATSNKEGKDLVLPPKGLADLLISSILIDTKLRPLEEGGKATKIDFEAVSKLVPYSSFATIPSTTPGGGGEIGILGNDDEVLKGLKERGSLLGRLKEDVSWMNGRDLLRRDYKEYVSIDKEGRELKYGLSTVPLGLSVWLEKFEKEKPGKELEEGVLGDLREWMKEKGLALGGVLTSYTHVKRKSGKEGKHRRELLGLTTDQRLGRVVFEGLGRGEDNVIRVDLELGEWKELKNYGGESGKDEGESMGEGGQGYERWKVWQQGNTKATRKQVAPILKELVHEALGIQ